MLSDSQVQTRVRYELVGVGRTSYREQRVGYWQLLWSDPHRASFAFISGTVLDETKAVPPAHAMWTFAGSALRAIRPFPRNSCMEQTTGGPCSTPPAASIFTVTTESPLATSMATDLTTSTSADGGLPNRLYRNRGDGTFEDITESAGVGVIENTACALFATLTTTGNRISS